MASSKFIIPLSLSSSGVALTGYTGHVYIVPVGSAVNGTMPLTEDSTTPGTYYRDSVDHGQYNLYVDTDKSGSPVTADLKLQNIDHGVIDDAVNGDKIVDASVGLNHLTQAAKDYIGSGGTVSNNPDDVYLKTNASSEITWHDDYADKFDGDASASNGIEKVGLWDHIKNNNIINVKDFGAVGDGITDDTTAIQDAIDFCVTNYSTTYYSGTVGTKARVFAEGEFKITSTITISCEVDFQNAIFIVPDAFTSTAVKVQANDGTSRLQLNNSSLPIIKTTQNTSWAYSNTGLKLTSLYNSRLFLNQIWYFETGLEVTTWASDGCCYNDFHLNLIRDNKIGINIEPATGGWTNDNNWFGGKIVIESGYISYTGTILLKISGNNNVFQKLCVEGNYDETKIYFNGTNYPANHNQFIGLRPEKSTGAWRVYADGDVSYNYISGYFNLSENEIDYVEGTVSGQYPLNLDAGLHKTITGGNAYGVLRIKDYYSATDPIISFYGSGDDPYNSPDAYKGYIALNGFGFRYAASDANLWLRARNKRLYIGHELLDITTAPNLRANQLNGDWLMELNDGAFRLPTNAYNSNQLILGSYYIWVDSTGDLRIKNGEPTSDTDGTVVGTQS